MLTHCSGAFSHLALAHAAVTVSYDDRSAAISAGPDMFFSRVGRDAVVNTGILPLATQGLKRGFRESGWERGANTPLAILAPAVGITFRAIKALLPAGLSK